MSDMRPIHITLDLYANDKQSALEALVSLCEKYRERINLYPCEVSGMSSGYEHFGFCMWEYIDAEYLRHIPAPAPPPDSEGRAS